MRRRRRHDISGTEVALANFALTFAKALLVFCVVLFMLISTKEDQSLKPTAEFLITINWTSPTVRYDIDLWTLLPNSTKVAYINKESGIVFLERDDLGGDCVLAKKKNGEKANQCEEITVIRGFEHGDYEVALHLYSVDSVAISGPCVPIEVNMVIEKLNPVTTVVWQGVITLDSIRQEKDVVKFSIEGGQISNLRTINLPAFIYDDQKRH